MVVLWRADHDLLVAVDGLGVVLLAVVHVGEFEPGLLVLLVELNEFVQESNSFTMQVHITVQSNKTLRALLVERVLFNQVK